MCEVMQQISTSAPTSDSLSPGWSSTIYITQSHKMEERTHTDPERVRTSRLAQKQVTRTLLPGVHHVSGELDLTNLLRRAALQLLQAAGQQPAMAPGNKHNVKLHVSSRCHKAGSIKIHVCICTMSHYRCKCPQWTQGKRPWCSGCYKK